MVIEFLPDIIGAIIGREALKDDVGLIVGTLAGEAFRRHFWKDLLRDLGLRG